MKTKHFSALLLGLLLFGLSACDTLRPEETASPDSSVKLMQTMYSIIKSENVPPPRAARIYGYVSVAYYEGLVNGYSNYRTLAGQLNGLTTLPKPESGQDYNWQLVAEVAATEVAKSLLTQEKTTLQATTTTALNALKSGSLTTDIAFGTQLAQALVQYADQDGYLTTRGKAYTPPTGEGIWIPTAPEFAAPLEPYWGTLRPFVVNPNYTDCQASPPPAFSDAASSQFLIEAKEVYEVSKTLTSEQKTIANYWADGPGATGTPPGHWVAITTQMVQDNKLSLIESAELYARIGISLSDAFMTGWNTKYKYNLERPITCIRRVLDANWSPLLPTPNFPEYVSGHSIGSGAAAFILTNKLGTVSFTDKTHQSIGLGERSFKSFHDAAQEAAISRLYGGIHFRKAIDVGISQGNCIAQQVTANIKTKR